MASHLEPSRAERRSDHERAVDAIFEDERSNHQGPGGPVAE
jgi:hypothetical protein